MNERADVAVIGAGTMGNGIAHVFAQYGHAVTLIDVGETPLAKAIATIRSNLERQVKKGTLTAEQAEQTIARIRTSTDRAAAANAALVVEAVPEDEALKRSVLTDVGKLNDHGVIASNTSSISITSLARTVHHPERVIGMHFMNPVPVMKLVEVIRGLQTAEQTLRSVIAWVRGLDRTPVEVNDRAGFVSNRVLMPMINEAIFCLMEGVAEPEAIDTVMKLGMNHPMGPLALADLIGLDTCLSIMEVLQHELGDKYRPCALLRQYVAAGWLGRKTGRGFYNYATSSS